MQKLVQNSKFPRSSLQFFAALAAAILACFFAPSHALADGLTVSLSPLSDVAAGSSGNSFDVLLTNSSGLDYSIDGFSFDVASSSSDVTFTDATTSPATAPYIFDGESLFGPDIIGPGSTATDINGSDIGASSFSLTPGTTVALGQVLFDVSSTAPTQVVTFSLNGFPGTSLSDEAGNDIPIDTFIGGQFTIEGATAPVPEPSTLILVFAAVPLVFVRRRTTG
jgi:hypothetical protein